MGGPSMNPILKTCFRPDFKLSFEKPSNLELATYLADAPGPVPLVLDLRLAHERWGLALTLALMVNDITSLLLTR